MNRNELIEKYAQHVVDGMDFSDVIEYVYNDICDRLDSLGDADLEAEISVNAPDLLNE